MLKITIEAACRYMDDGRTALYRFKHGWRWVSGRVIFCERWALEDEHLSGLEVTKRIIEGTMQGIEDFLVFTMETGDEFPEGWLPTLDTNIKVSEENVIQYKFFEKPMSANTVLHMRTAMAEDSKVRSLTNDLVRRLLTTSESLPDKLRWKIIDDFAQKLLNSGYKLEQTRRIIVAGLKGYEKKLRESKIPGGRKMHRTSKESSVSRAWRKLTGKTEWFRDGARKKEDKQELHDGWNNENIPGDWKSGLGKTKRVKKKSEKEKSDRGSDQTVPSGWKTRSVLVVPVSRNGELAKNIREVEKRMNVITDYKTKIIESVGKKLKDLMSNKNPWSGQECGRGECVPCGQAGDRKINCTQCRLAYA